MMGNINRLSFPRIILKVFSGGCGWKVTRKNSNKNPNLSNQDLLKRCRRRAAACEHFAWQTNREVKAIWKCTEHREMSLRGSDYTTHFSVYINHILKGIVSTFQFHSFLAIWSTYHKTICRSKRVGTLWIYTPSFPGNKCIYYLTHMSCVASTDMCYDLLLR